MINPSQKKELRFWEKWHLSGAIGVAIDKMIALENAERWLRHVEEGASDRESHIGFVRDYLAEANARPEDIGTSDEELAELLQEGYLNAAWNWLGHVKADTSDREFHIGYIREFLAKANARPEDIGTSDEELAELLQEGFLNAAKTWLEHAKTSGITSPAHISYVRDFLTRANAQPEDIGTSEDELLKLARRSA